MKYPVLVVFAIIHTTNGDVELGGYTIPGGSIILPNIHTALRDEKYLKNPDVFDPERWLDSEGKIKNIPGFIPFSIGRFSRKKTYEEQCFCKQ